MSSSARLRLLIHPAFCGAVALVAVNDQLLKARWPGVVTGKLSDVAGVFAATIAVAAATGAVRRAAVAVVCGFAALKLSTDVARLAAPLLGGRTRQDATDLLALVALWPAVRFVERGLPAAGRHDRARRNDAASTALVVAAIAATVLTTTATSCERNDGVVGFVVADDGAVSAKTTDYTTTWYTSSDGGITWSPAAGVPTGQSSGTEACLDRRCLRVTGTSVEQRDGDGPWTTSFTYSPAQRANMEERLADYEPGCHTRLVNMFSSVVNLQSGGRRIDLVAMGTEGALRRVDGGEWERIGVGPDDRPVSAAPSTGWPARWRTLWLLGPLALIALAPLIARRRRRVLSTAVALAIAFGAMTVIGGATFFFALRAPTPILTVTSLVAAYSFVVWFARRNPLPVVPPAWPTPWPTSPPWPPTPPAFARPSWPPPSSPPPTSSAPPPPSRPS